MAPAVEKRQAVKTENLSDDIPLSEEEYEKIEQRHIKENPEMVLPSIVYPLPLHNYSLPCELGSFIFWNTFNHAQLTLDCETIGIPNSEKLLNLCNY